MQCAGRRRSRLARAAVSVSEDHRQAEYETSAEEPGICREDTGSPFRVNGFRQDCLAGALVTLRQKQTPERTCLWVGT
jgi:hypothetical protein